MTEAIPLGAALCIESQNLIVDCPWSEIDQLVLEPWTLEGWKRRLVNRPVERDTNALLDLECCCLDRVGSDQVQATQLVIFSEQTPGISWRAILVERQLIEFWPLHFQIFKASIWIERSV